MNRTTRLAAIYARISTDKQNPLSPADQERKCREYAGQNGIAVLDAHVYVDEGLSGVGMDRPSLQRMLRAAPSPAKPFDVILVDDTSRLSRSTESVLSIYRKLNFAGLQLISVSEGIDSRDRTKRKHSSRFTASSIAAMSESLRRKHTAAVSPPFCGVFMWAEVASVTRLRPWENPGPGRSDS